MTREEAIKWFENAVPKNCSECSKEYDFSCNEADSIRCEAYMLARNALREQEERSKNEPLTLDELRKMNGQPVWVANDGFWALVRVDLRGEVSMIANDGDVAYAKGWIKHVGPIYRRKPEVEG